MLTIKKIGAVALVMGVTFAACTDDPQPDPNLQMEKYSLIRGLTDSVQVGTVEVHQHSDSTVSMYLGLTKTSKDTVSRVYVIKGKAALPTTDTIYKGTFSGSGTGIQISIWSHKDNLRYDSLIKTEAFAKVVYSATKDSVAAIGNIFKTK
jgi:hypothetical protein